MLNQVDALKRHLRAKGYRMPGGGQGVRTHSLASAGGSDEDEEAGNDDVGDEDGEEEDGNGESEEAEEEKHKADTPKLPEYKKMRVCDGLGCHTQVVPDADPPHVITHESIQQQLEGALSSGDACMGGIAYIALHLSGGPRCIAYHAHIICHESEGAHVETLAGKSLTDALFPDPHTWEPEVHLNDKGQIRADHDDPNGVCVQTTNGQ